MTSRRNLLRGAAVATAATVGVAALGATQTAHAATGDNLILGAVNSASAETRINDTGYNSEFIFSVNNGATAGPRNAAIWGTGTNGVSGVLGQTTTGYGVFGYTSNNGIGVYGEDPGRSTAILGSSANGLGLVGRGTTNGWGVVGESSASYDFVANGTGIIGVNVQANAGAPTAGPYPYTIGDSIRDANGELWLCIATGNPGTWVMAAHVLEGYSGGVTNYLSKPIRLFDSRPGATAYAAPGVKPSSNAPTSVQVAGITYNGVTVPANLTGAIGNLTVLNESGGGYIELVPSGAGFTGASNIAFNPGLTLANAYTVALTQGKLDIILGGAGTVTTDVIIDLFAFVA